MLDSIKKFLSDRQSTLISGLSALLIIVLGFLLFSYFSRINRQTVTRQTVPVEEATTSGLLTEATSSSIFEEKPSPQLGQVAKKAEEPKPTQTTPQNYNVVKGDTLSAIAQRFYGDPNKYPLISGLKENNITNPHLIHAGNVFVIPPLSIQLASVPTQLPASGKSDFPSGISPSESVQLPSQHLVQAGETLWGLAQMYYDSGYEWYKIGEANSDHVGYLPDGSGRKALIIPGQILIIPDIRSSDSPS